MISLISSSQVQKSHAPAVQMGLFVRDSQSEENLLKGEELKKLASEEELKGSK